MSERTTPDSVSTLGPLEPSPGKGPAVSSGISPSATSTDESPPRPTTAPPSGGPPFGGPPLLEVSVADEDESLAQPARAATPTPPKMASMPRRASRWRSTILGRSWERPRSWSSSSSWGPWWSLMSLVDPATLCVSCAVSVERLRRTHPQGGRPGWAGSRGATRLGSMDLSREVLRALRDQEGVISRSQAIAGGLRKTDIDRLVRRREWVRLAAWCVHRPHRSTHLVAARLGWGPVLPAGRARRDLGDQGHQRARMAAARRCRTGLDRGRRRSPRPRTTRIPDSVPDSLRGPGDEPDAPATDASRRRGARPGRG